ncbi:MAG: hypothetical protein KUG68_08750 [Flavobacteriaceae bacterium]|nr:hypothetical protein [Flavobacteriaceae bacterium]
MNRQEKLVIFIIITFLLIEFLLLHDLPFFWDAISKSSRADWIYTHQFSSLIVPTDINSGHPPLWITGIALFWTFLGKSIWAARLLLLLVNFGVFYQIFLLAKNSFKGRYSIFLVLLVLLEPTLIAQSTILNNDMLLLFFVLLGINSLFKNKHWLYALALTGMLLTNLRGIYCSLALIIIHVWLYKAHLLDYNKKMLKSYLISFLVLLGFILYQYSELGWFLISKNEGYSEHRKVTELARMAKNSAAIVKNLLEYGRLIVWIPLVFLAYQFLNKKYFQIEKQSSRLLISLIVFCVVFFLGFVPFSNPMGPRYLLICFILANILFINLMYLLVKSIRLKRMYFAIIIIAFITGHFWIYPATIAQGWDCSLAYLNYFEQEKKMLEFIDNQKISRSSVGTNTTINTRWLSTLKDELKEEAKFETLSLNKNEFVLFSNIENITSDEDIVELRTNWVEIKSYSQLGVFITLYKNPNQP